MAVNAEPMTAFEREEVILVELFIADLAKLTFALFNWLSLAIDKVLIEIRDKCISLHLLFLELIVSNEHVSLRHLCGIYNHFWRKDLLGRVRTCNRIVDDRTDICFCRKRDFDRDNFFWLTTFCISDTGDLLYLDYRVLKINLYILAAKTLSMRMIFERLT